MTIKEIDEQISKLNNLRYQKEQEENVIFKEEAKENIGRCFIMNGRTYIKVINIPQEIFSMSNMSCHGFNKYQYPALFIRGISKCPFEIDTLFSAAWGEGNDYVNTYEEITCEEFNEKFEETLKEFKNTIINV